MSDLEGTMPLLKDRVRASRPRFLPAQALPPQRVEKDYLPGQSTRFSVDLLSWWPLAVGIALGALAPWLQDFISDTHPWVMRLVFPLFLVSGRKELGLGEELTRTLPGLVLYLQFPLEGLLTRYTLSKGAPMRAAIGQLFAIHLSSALVLWLIDGSLPQ